MDKIIFHRNTPVTDKGSSVIRIRPYAFVEIEKISKATGMSISDVATRLLAAALERVEIVD